MKKRSNAQSQPSRREFMKVAGSLLGLAAGQALVIGVGRSAVLDLVARTAQAADPRSPYWGFVVDVSKCIGCGKCVLACKKENRVPMLPGCFRTWVERYQITADREMIVDSPNGGMDGFAAPAEATGSLPSHPEELHE